MHSNRWFFLLLSFLTFHSGSSHALIVDRIAAIVNGNVITLSEVTAIDKLDLQLSGLPKVDSPLQNRINHHLVLDELVKQPPVAISNEDVQQSIREYFRAHGYSDDFEQFLTSNGMSYSEFVTEVREQLGIRRFITLRFRPFVNITIDQAEKYYESVYKPRFEASGLDVPTFEESFTEIQTLLVESQVQDRIRTWLEELRKKATINIKE